MQEDNSNTILNSSIQTIEFILKNFKSIIANKQDLFIKQGIKYLQPLRDICVDINKLSSIQAQQLINFVKEKSYNIKCFAQSLKINGINTKWFHIILEKIYIQLLELKMLGLNQSILIYNIVYRIKVYVQLIIYAVVFPKDDIFNNNSNQYSDAIKQFTTYKIVGSTQQIAAQILNVVKIINATEAAQQQIQQSSNFLQRKYNSAFGLIKNLFRSQNRNRKSIEFKFSINPLKLKSMINGLSQGITGKLVEMTYEKILYVKLIYICQSYGAVTSQAVLKWLKQQNKYKLELEKPIQLQQEAKANIFTTGVDKITVRVLSNVKFERLKNELTHNEDNEFVIFHIHGGGFLLSSSKPHQQYTRKWVKQCNISIFSVDYKKTPEFPFPCAVNDVWQTYNWILYESHKYFRLKQNKKIIVMGDSAGGNLALAVTNLSIMSNIQKPYRVVPFYPGTNCNTNIFTPSYLHTFYDPFLTYQVKKLFIVAYICKEEFKSEQNFLLSPLFTPIEILSKYPPIFVFGGQKDMLYDDVIRFCLKLWKSKANIKLTVYRDMIHGYLSLARTIPSSKHCLQDSIQIIKEILKKKQQN